MQAPRGSSPAPLTASRGGRLPRKIVRNRIENPVPQRVGARASKSAQSAPEELPKWSQNPTNALQSRLRRDFLPNGSTFIKHAQACTDCMSGPPPVPLFYTFSTKRVSKSPLGKGFAKSSPEITKSYATGATTVPQGPPKWHLVPAQP